MKALILTLAVLAASTAGATGQTVCYYVGDTLYCNHYDY